MGLRQRLASYLIKQVFSLSDPGAGRLIGSMDSHAGRPVTVDTALQLSTAWACIRLVSQTWGTLPVEVREFDGRVSKTTRDHPLYALLHDSPNADMTAVEFWSAMGVSLLTWGNAYAEIDRAGVGPGRRPVALTPLDPGRVWPERRANGAIFYRYTDPAGKRREIAEDDMLHIKGVSRDGLIGMSPIAQARHTLGLAQAANEAAGSIFANGLRVPGHYVSPAILSAPDRAQAKTMIEGFHSASQAGKAPLLEGGFKFESATIPPQEAQLLATMGFSVEEICRWYGVPPFMVGHTEKSTSWGSGLESQMLAFHTLTLRPILKNAEHAIRRRLLSPAERGRVEVDFNVEGLLRADSAGRAAYLKVMVEAGIYTPNEARAYEGKPPLPGGDDLHAQSNMIPLRMLGQAGSRADLPPNAALTEDER